MGATMFAMWRAAVPIAIAALAALAGCDDPSLRVEVLPPVPAFDEVGAISTTVTVYQSSTIDCFAIEIGKADPEQLAIAKVASANVEAGEILVGVSRVEPKLFVAEAYDVPTDPAMEPRRLYAGCEARGEITGDEVVEIQTYAVATTTVSGDALDRPFSRRRIEVAAADAQGRPIDGRHVEWTSFGITGAFGAEGSAISKPTLCTDTGIARVEPLDPDIPGPVAAQIRVSWAESTPAPLSGFITDVTNQVSLSVPGADSTRWPPACVARHAGTPVRDHVYCLGKPLSASDARPVLELTETGDTIGAQAVGVAVNANHLVATTDGSGDDDLYAIERVAGRVRWHGLAGTADGGNYDPCDFVTGACAVGAVRRVVVVPACNPGDTGFAITSFSLAGKPDFPVYTDLHGIPLPMQPPFDVDSSVSVDLLAGGCVSEATTPPAIHQAFALRVTPMSGTMTPFNQLIAACDDQPCTARWSGLGAVGFSTGATPRLLSSDLDITGNVIVESEIVPTDPGELLLVERGRTAAAAQARSIVSGDIDGDSRVDLAWSQFLLDEVGATENRIQLAVDRAGLPFPGRLAGISPSLPGDQALILFADLDANGVPDLVSYSDTEAAVYRFGVEVPHGTPADPETTCP